MFVVYFFTSSGPTASRSEAQGPTKRNPIQEENSKPGSTDWQLTRVKLDKGMASFRTSLIEGYCSHQAVQAGDTLQIMISTAPAARFKIEIFRTGYYAGKGARLTARIGEGVALLTNTRPPQRLTKEGPLRRLLGRLGGDLEIHADTRRAVEELRGAAATLLCKANALASRP